jgi:peptide/nickel transport system substrate-binding protein
MRRQWCVALVALLALLAAACTTSPEPTPPPGEGGAVRTGTPQAGTPRRGGTLTVAATSDAVSFHPYKTTDSASGSYQGYVFGPTLTKRDPKTLDIVPELAEKWTISEDKTTYTFTLREGLKWSDGQPITSADFLWTFQQANNPNNKYPYRSNFEEIVSYEAPDPRTIVVKIKEPLAVGLEMADAVTPLPKHVWEKYDWNDPEKNPEIMKPTVGHGMWKLKEWRREDHATFVPNDLYYDGPPHIAELVVRIVPSQAVAFQMLRSGEVDWASFAPADYQEAKGLQHVAVYEWWLARGNWSYIGFNLRKPVLQDKRVRAALAHAIDRKIIIDRVQYGLAQPTYSAWPPSSWVYNPNVPKYEFNPQRAEQLLDEAGWRKGADGVRAKDGQRLQLKLLYGPNTNKVREGIATIAQEQWRQIGVQVEVTGLEWGAYLDTLSKPPFNYDLFVLGWLSTIDPHWSYQIWSEATIPDLNAGAYVNKEVEELFRLGAREFDREKRKQIYQKIQQIISEDLPYIFLTTNMSYTGINKRVKGIEPTALGIDYNINKWWIEQR